MAIKATALITLTRVNDGATGPKGNDGKGIKSTSVTYQAWNNGTTHPPSNSGWGTTPPKTTADNPYLWTRTVITYTDNTQSTSYSVGSTPEGIVVGGRNLIIGSSKADSSKWVQQGHIGSIQPYSEQEHTYKITTSNGWSEFYYKDLKNYAGKVVTIHFLAKNISSETTATGNYALAYANSDSGYHTEYFTPDKPQQDNWIAISRTLTLNDKGAFGIGCQCQPENKNLKTTWLIKNLKFELGNKATDWTPAPEDQEQYVNDKISASEKTTEESYKALINQTAKDINILVQNVQKETSANTASISEMSTNFKVTADGLSATKSAVKTLTDAVNGSVSKEEMKKYIRWNGDNLELGNSAQPFKCKLSNTELAFYQNTDKVAWITNKELYILKAIIAQSIGCGNFLFVDEGDLGFSLI